MHVQGIAHRDIKPEKIMVTDEDELKLIGFKYSEKKEVAKHMTDVIGTPYFTAPEVLDGFYDTQCDNWSAGVLLYMFLSGYLPF